MLAAVLALIAAAVFALGSVLQAKAATRVPDQVSLNAGLLFALLRQPLWLFGIGAGALGYALQAAALAVGAVVLVQPILTVTLLFALPLQARFNGRRIATRDLVAAVVLVISLAAFVAAGEPEAGVNRAPFDQWATWCIPLLVVAAIGVAIGARTKHVPRAAALGVATGICFGVVAPLTKSTLDALSDGLPAVLTSWELYALALIGLASVFLQQASYQADAFAAAYPPAEVLQPIVGVVLGIVVLDETLRTDDIRVVVIGLAVLCAIVATVTLARDDPGSSAPDSAATR